VSTGTISLVIGAGALVSALAALTGFVERRSARRLVPIPLPVARRVSEDREQATR
jgi:hypothetical protein